MKWYHFKEILEEGPEGFVAADCKKISSRDGETTKHGWRLRVKLDQVLTVAWLIWRSSLGETAPLRSPNGLLVRRCFPATFQVNEDYLYRQVKNLTSLNGKR